MVVVTDRKLKALEFNASHKDKLKEMADSLFEDYNFMNIYENGWSISFYKLGDSGDMDSMPWLQFCIFELPYKLANISNLSPGYIMENWFYNQQVHIIDYLFEIFQKHT